MARSGGRNGGGGATSDTKSRDRVTSLARPDVHCKISIADVSEAVYTIVFPRHNFVPDRVYKSGASRQPAPHRAPCPTPRGYSSGRLIVGAFMTNRRVVVRHGNKKKAEEKKHIEKTNNNNEEDEDERVEKLAAKTRRRGWTAR